MNANLAAFVARDPVARAEEIAQAAVAAHRKGHHILALGDEGTNIAQEERTGCYRALPPYLDRGDIKIVSQQFDKNWSLLNLPTSFQSITVGLVLLLAVGVDIRGRGGKGED